jgi:hypothetical protein
MSSSRAPENPQDSNTATETPRNTGVAEQTPALADSPTATAEATSPSIEVAAPSGERRSRPVRQKPRAASEDTLLSVPAPAPSFEVEVEDTLGYHEQRLEELAGRVRALESRQVSTGGISAGSQSWLVWVVFLLALALAWQIFARGR